MKVRAPIIQGLMKTLFKIIGVFLVVAAATVLSGTASVAGAEAAGWRQSQWAIMIAAPLFFGLVGGLILSILSFVCLLSIRGYREALIAGFVCPTAVAFVGAFAIYFVALFPERHANQQPVAPKDASGVLNSSSTVAPSSVAF